MSDIMSIFQNKEQTLTILKQWTKNSLIWKGWSEVKTKRTNSTSMKSSQTKIKEHELKDHQKRIYMKEDIEIAHKKKPDAIVSNIYNKAFTYTKLITEIKSNDYDYSSIGVLWDKYRLAIYGKECLDFNIDVIILVQGLGSELKFYIMSLEEEAFYITTYHSTITLPLAIADMKNFVRDLKVLYEIRSILENRSVVIQVSNAWTRPSLETPSFERMMKVDADNIPTKKRFKRCLSEDDDFVN